MTRFLSSALLALLALATTAFAADSDDKPSRLVFGFQAAYGIEDGIPRNISHINMLYAQPQIGIVAWNSPHSRLPLRRFEVISEGMLGNSVHPGGHIYGDTLLFRFTGGAVRSIVPFVDVGSGPLNTTINKRASELGGNTQFLSQGGFGVQRGMFVAEWRYFHMSNAGLVKPNHGFNGNIFSVGIRWSKHRD